MTYPTRSAVLSDGRFEIRAHTSPVGPESTLTALDGWYEPELRVEFSERIGGGVLPARSEWDKRSLMLGGHISGLSPDGVRDQLRVLSAIAAPGTLATLTVDDFGMRLVATVVRVGKPRQSHSLEHGWVEWELSMVAPDPHLYGPARALRVSTPSSDYGLDWPLFANGDVLTWGSGADLTISGWIVNDGTAAAWPTVTVYGDFPSGVSVGDGSGQAVTFAGVVTPQAPLVLDFAAHTATVGGEARSHMLTGRGFFQVPPGGVLRPVLRAVGVGSGYADVQVRSTYM